MKHTAIKLKVRVVPIRGRKKHYHIVLEDGTKIGYVLPSHAFCVAYLYREHNTPAVSRKKFSPDDAVRDVLAAIIDIELAEPASPLLDLSWYLGQDD
jgi:hypothetical protein